MRKVTKDRDWIGNKRTVYTTLGASNHTDKDREQHDFYATEPKAIELLLKRESFAPNVWECACGAGHLARVLNMHGYNVRATDLIDRGYGVGGWISSARQNRTMGILSRILRISTHKSLSRRRSV